MKPNKLFMPGIIKGCFLTFFSLLALKNTSQTTVTLTSTGTWTCPASLPGTNYDRGTSGAMVSDGTTHNGSSGANGLVKINYAVAPTGAALPYCQNFDGAWTTAASISAPAWSSVGTGDNEWHRNNYTTGWNNPTFGAYSPTGANGTTNSARFHSYDANTGTTGTLISPSIDFSSSVGNKYVDFYYINVDGTDKLRVYLSTNGGTTWGAAISPTPLSTVGVWTKYTCDLGTSTSVDVKIKFEATADFGNTDIGLDEVCVYTPAPMNYVSSSVSQASTADTYPGATNQEIISIQIVTTGSSSPLSLTQMIINMIGSTAITDVSNIDIYHTGTSSTFAATTLVESVTPAAGSLTVAVAPSVTLQTGTNYFWVVYDVAAAAVITHSLDAQCTQITMSGTVGIQTPTSPNPNGIRPIVDAPKTFARWIEKGFGNDVVRASDGSGYIWVGKTDNTYSTGGTDAYFVKTNNDVSAVLWTSVLGTGGTETLNDVVETSDGFVAVGNVGFGADILVVKTNTAGVIQWTKTINRTGESDDGQAIIKTSDGNVAIAGSSGFYGYFAQLNNADGSIIDDKVFNNSDVLDLYCITQTNDGGFLLGGISHDDVSPDEFQIVKISSALALQWDKRWGTSGSADYITFVTQNTDGSYVVGGRSNIAGGNGSTDGYLMNFTISATTPTVNWVYTYGNADANTFDDGVKTPNGGYAFTGKSPRVGDSGNQEALVTKISSNGTMEFMVTIGSTDPTEDDEGYGLDVNADGSLVAAGMHRDASFAHFYMMKISGAGENCSAVQNIGTRKSLSTSITFNDDGVTGISNPAMTVTTPSNTSVGGIITGGCFIPLPIKLLFFTGYNNNTENVLKWSTASETNNNYFTIERSRDGLIWEVLGKVKGTGTSDEVNDYSLTDYSPFSQITYYRLKQTDFDGITTKSSDVISLECCGNTKNTNYYLYPNPTTGDLAIKANKPIAQGSVVEVINSIGQKVLEKTITSETDEVKISLDTDFAVGVYLVILRANNETYYKEKIIKK